MHSILSAINNCLFLTNTKVTVYVCGLLSCSVMSDSVIPWTVAHQASLSMGFSRQEYWSGLLFPSAGDLLDPWIEPVSLAPPALTGGFFTTGLPGKPKIQCRLHLECVQNWVIIQWWTEASLYQLCQYISSHEWLEIRHGSSIYTTEIGNHFNQYLLFSKFGKPVCQCSTCYNIYV